MEMGMQFHYSPIMLLLPLSNAGFTEASSEGLPEFLTYSILLGEYTSPGKNGSEVVGKSLQ